VFPSDLADPWFCSAPFTLATATPRRTVPKISRASTIPACCGSISRQRATPRIHTPLRITAHPVPVAMINSRGGNDWRSGTSGKSKTSTYGIFPRFLCLRGVKFRPQHLVNRLLHFQFPKFALIRHAHDWQLPQSWKRTSGILAVRERLPAIRSHQLLLLMDEFADTRLQGAYLRAAVSINLPDLLQL
jgi:hypothetical protein